MPTVSQSRDAVTQAKAALEQAEVQYAGLVSGAPHAMAILPEPGGATFAVATVGSDGKVSEKTGVVGPDWQSPEHVAPGPAPEVAPPAPFPDPAHPAG